MTPIKSNRLALGVDGGPGVPSRIFFRVLCALTFTISAAAQTIQPAANFGSIPSGTASGQVLHLTLRDAINMVLRYNLDQVVQAQQSLASANDQYISSLYSHNLAKLQLARALGVARTNYSRYLVVH